MNQIKKMLVLASLLVMASAQASEVFVCGLQDNSENWGGIGKFKQINPKSTHGEQDISKTKDFVGYKCVSLEREEYYLTFRGYSISLAWQPQEGFILSFIGAGDGTRKKNQDKPANFYGARLSATIGAGVSAMVAGNHRGLFTAFGLNTGIGFDVSAVHIKFGKKSAYPGLFENQTAAVPVGRFGEDPLKLITSGEYGNIPMDEKTARAIEEFRLKEAL